MYPRIAMVRRAEEDGALIALIRRRAFGWTEVCPGKGDAVAIVRADGSICFVVGKSERLCLAFSDRLYRIDLLLGGLSMRQLRAVFTLPRSGKNDFDPRGEGFAVRYSVELQDFRRFFLSHYSTVRKDYPYMAETRFSPISGAPMPNLLSEIGGEVSSFCRDVMMRVPILREEDAENGEPPSFLRAVAAFGEREFAPKGCGIVATVDFGTLSALPNRFKDAEVDRMNEAFDERSGKA